MMNGKSSMWICWKNCQILCKLVSHVLLYMYNNRNCWTNVITSNNNVNQETVSITLEHLMRYHNNLIITSIMNQYNLD